MPPGALAAGLGDDFKKPKGDIHLSISFDVVHKRKVDVTFLVPSNDNQLTRRCTAQWLSSPAKSCSGLSLNGRTLISTAELFYPNARIGCLGAGGKVTRDAR